MRTTTIKFDQVWAYATAHVPCLTCGATTQRTVKEWCSINPFNTVDTPNGKEMASRSQVREQAQRKADEMVKRAEAEGRTCTKCKLAKAPAFEHQSIEADDLQRLVASGKEIAEKIEALMKPHDDFAKALVGKDVMIRDELAQITGVHFFRDYWSLEYRFYSKSKSAAPGQLRVEVNHQHIADRLIPKYISAPQVKVEEDA